MLRNARSICEERSSEQAALDFRGIFTGFGGDDTDPLLGYARARKQELAEAQILDARMPGLTVMSSHVIPDGVPERGADNPIARLNGNIVYVMAPIGLHRVRPPRRRHPHYDHGGGLVAEAAWTVQP